MISSRCPSTAGVVSSRVSARRGSATQTAASVARTACPGSIGILPSSRFMPKATGAKRPPPGAPGRGCAGYAAMPRWGKRASGSTESMTSTPRTKMTVKFGRPSVPNVVTAYQASARPAEPQRNTAGALCAGSDLVALSTGFSFIVPTACNAHTPRGSPRRSWNSWSEGRSSFRPAHSMYDRHTLHSRCDALPAYATAQATR